MEEINRQKTRHGCKKTRSLRVIRILCWVFGILFLLLSLLAASLLIADNVADRYARVLPSYPKEDILPVLQKENWTDEDYDLLYRQTGLGRLALDELKGSNDTILSFQTALFFEGEVYHEAASFTTPHDYLVDPETGRRYTAPIVPLEDGDVLVSSSCHTFGWRNGHSALVTNGDSGSVLESVTLGMNSQITYHGANWFCQASNFMVLRLKGVSKEERAAIAAAAAKTLNDVPYSILVGFFFDKKDQCANGATPKHTHCSHLVWQAYKNAGYDIDSDGGSLCSTNDIARSPLFEIVQVYGFDPVKLW